MAFEGGLLPEIRRYGRPALPLCADSQPFSLCAHARAGPAAHIMGDSTPRDAQVPQDSYERGRYRRHATSARCHSRFVRQPSC
eukprot:2836522-Pleurochrysis_carterae.AAC.1